VRGEDPVDSPLLGDVRADKIGRPCGARRLDLSTVVKRSFARTPVTIRAESGGGRIATSFLEDASVVCNNAETFTARLLIEYDQRCGEDAAGSL